MTYKDEFIQKEKLHIPSITVIQNILRHNIQSKNIKALKESYSKYISTSDDKQNLLDYCLFISLAPEEPKIQLANFFIKNGANINSELMHTNIIKDHNKHYLLPIFLYASQNSNQNSFKIMHYMLKNNYNPTNDFGDHNFNALHYIIFNTIFKDIISAEEIILKKLLNTPININHQSETGNTPFHFLLNNNNLAKRFSIIELFLEKKPIVTLTNNTNISIYDLCVSVLNDPYISFTPELENTKQKILTSIEKLYLEQKISQTQSFTKNKLKI